MKKLGSFFKKHSESIKTIEHKFLKQGINDVGEHFVKVSANGGIDYVINKVCDHAGGRLILKENVAVCPLHDWRLNLESLQYNNSHECKKTVDFNLDEDGNIQVAEQKSHLVNPFKGEKKGEVKLRWLNHATVYIECNGKSIITDPWLFGPAFLTGWWLASPSPEDSIELLRNADYVFISHNHPDHLHAETLSILPKNKKLIVADFGSKSAEKYLQALGFTNIQALSFNDIFAIGDHFQISILKSGDFRDDSGLYVYANGHEYLLTVDCNFLNFNILPREVDMLFTSFAGGASGFPLCFHNYTEEEKGAILKRNKGAVKFLVTQYLQAAQPRYYSPYAGMFSEYAERDSYIKETNQKNAATDYAELAQKHKAQFIAPAADQEIIFTNGTLILNKLEVDFLQPEETEFYIDKLKEEYQYDADAIIAYFKESNYSGKQIIEIIPTDDNFEQIVGGIVYADFYKKEFRVITEKELVTEEPGYRVMQLKVRPEAFMCVVENYLPWEDFSIGFQMRVTRMPNEYESDFWYHFTNNYIGKRHFRYSSFCGACTVIEQNPIWVKTETA
ncbi:MBL fold metallo-hydrolase [Chitinophaga filiformis]|uniref:Cytidine monophosphate-N-acetylneuraminic acid hydroxylase n=1 Tax=Chitinophaga filiformis TaxID=104663 RepID=A0A1G7XP58_CHIFI|nr:MBL fold metallo-hydrolase [Chitinophaga filiformis]SDG85440.1 CMP-N-acetylneuraminate monooxygenase [Chitinophaga filiformis]